MQKIAIKITLLNPVLLTSNTGDPNMVATYPYIPARALRGLFANEYIKKYNLFKNARRDPRFYQWFLRGKLIFTDAFILDEDRVSIPIPFSIQKEKRGEKIYDLLHEEPDQSTKPIGGYGRIEDSIIYEYPVNRTLNFHHARDRERGISKEGLIFNYESLEPNQSFGGYIMGRKEDIDEFLEIFKSGHYYLGRSRNNQYGKVYIELNAKLDPHPEPDLEKLTSLPKIGISLISDTIIYNDYGFPVTDVNQLEKILGCKIEKAFIKTSYVESFVSIWRLRTPSEVSFMAGSTFLCNIPDQNTLQRLLELREKGLGERTEEGFGRFIFVEVKDELKNPHKEEKESPEHPSSVPSMLKDIITETLKKHILTLVKSEAIKTAGDVQNHPTPSLIGRLLLMLKDSKDYDDFIKKIEKLRKLAKEKLENCRIDRQSLYEFLRDVNPLESRKIKDLKTRKEFRELITLSERNPLEDEEFKKHTYKVYLEAFLTTLLKEAKKK